MFFQYLSIEMKREDMMRPYDPKKSVWVPTETHDFKEGLLESDDGTKAVVMLGHEVSCNQTLYFNFNLLVFLQNNGEDTKLVYEYLLTFPLQVQTITVCSKPFQ